MRSGWYQLRTDSHVSGKSTLTATYTVGPFVGGTNIDGIPGRSATCPREEIGLMNVNLLGLGLISSAPRR